MDKVLVGIHAPSVKEVCDAFVPLDVPIAQLAAVIADGFNDLTDGKYETSGLEMLSLMEPEVLFNPQFTLRDYNVKDGMQLYLL